jgi:ABC-type Mn2+/Zn2+ transport system permease subunit
VTWWISPFTENPFLVRALLAGLLVAWSAAIAGTFMVLRGLAFLGDALAHGVLPGVAGALLLGAPGLLGAAVGATVMIAGVNLVTSRSRLSSDTAIGLLFVGMLAVGVVMVSRSDTFSGDIVGILFGEILGASPGDLLQQAIALAVVAAVAGVFARPFLLLCFDPEQADVSGWPSRRYQALLLAMVTVTVVMSFQTVGTLLVFGMLLAPAGAGALLAHRLPAMIAWAAGIGSVSVYLGLLLSYHYDLAGSAAVVVVAVVVFFGVFAAQTVRQRYGGQNADVDAPVPPARPARGVAA